MAASVRVAPSRQVEALHDRVVEAIAHAGGPRRVDELLQHVALDPRALGAHVVAVRRAVGQRRVGRPQQEAAAVPVESGDCSTLGPRQASKSCAPGVSRSGPSLRQTGLEGTVNQLPGLAVRIAMSAPSAVIDSIHCDVLSFAG